MSSDPAVPTIATPGHHGLYVDGGTASAGGSLIRKRRATRDQWATANPILRAGEWGRETDTGREKTGIDNTTAWNDLPYDDTLTGESVAGIVVALS